MILRRFGIGSQILVAFTCVAFVSAVATSLLLKASFGIAFQNQRHLRAGMDEVIIAVLALSTLITVFIAVGAGILLRSGIREAVDRMRRATEAVAAGRYSHRIGETRGDELGALSKAIDCMAERLESANGARARMLAAVSHELRTPLTVIGGQAFTLMRSESRPEQRQRLEQINREVERLSLLINDLIDAASIETRQAGLYRTSVSVEEVLKEVALRFDHQASEIGIHLRISDCSKHRSGRVAIHVDVDRIHQVFANLISNAMVRAGCGVGTKEIHIAWEKTAHHVRINVTNTGETITSSEIRNCFKPFSQGRSPTGRTGLGLSIAKSIVEANGGTMSAGTKNGLTCFTVSLPLVANKTHGLRVLRSGDVEGVA